jgi:TolB-like protein/DNA-binding winged helix-turn-helix (wHTH) protein
LQAQPAQLLAILIDHAGETVTRETLRDDVWGQKTFVDFDRSINFCIAQIRTVLGDSAESPRFVRTIPKRGYQFIAPVSRPAASVSGSIPDAPSRGTRLPALVALTTLAVAALGSWWLLRPKPVQPPLTVAVLHFDNETGDPEFGSLADMLTDSVVSELTVAGYGRIAVIGNSSLLRAPRQTRDLLAIGSALKAGYVVLGQVQRAGSGIRILAHLIRLPEQKHVWVVRQESSPEQAVQRQADVAQRIAAEFCLHLDRNAARDPASGAASSALVNR